jgi:N-acetylglucosaminyl-diphospho-decaprenol L-rhamnosyltransferase
MSGAPFRGAGPSPLHHVATHPAPVGTAAPGPRPLTAERTAPAPALGRISVVILNYRAPDLTVRAAGAAMADGVPAERLVLVDNGSGDDSADRLREALPEAIVVELPANQSLSRALNAGARELEADAYVLLNNDAFAYAPGSFAAMARALEGPEVGMVVPRVLNEDLSLQRNVHPLHGPLSALVQASGLSRLVPDRLQPRLADHWRHGRSRDIWSAELPVVLVRGETWRALGGLDERIDRYGEEQDICRRCRRLGWRVWFAADAEFVHLGSTAGGDPEARVERAYRIGRSEAAVVREHLRPSAAAMSLGVWRAGLGARAAVHRALGHGARAAELRALARGCRSGWRLPPR